jgi:cytochrome c-type biogenesis protein CcmH
VKRRGAVMRVALVRSLLVMALLATVVAAGAATPEQSLDEAAILGPPQGRPLQGEELDSTARSLGERMRCPVCQGMPIADSPSASALAMMAQVRDLLARGYTEQQVLDYFVRSYGEFVLLEPTAEGFNLMVWLLPIAGVAVGAALIALRLRSARASRVATSGHGGASGERIGSSTTADPDLDRYVEQVRSEVGR